MLCIVCCTHAFTMHAIEEQISNILLKAPSNKHELWRGTSEKVEIPDLQHSDLRILHVYIVIVWIVNLHSVNSLLAGNGLCYSRGQIRVTLGARFVLLQGGKIHLPRFLRSRLHLGLDLIWWLLYSGEYCCKISICVVLPPAMCANFPRSEQNRRMKWFKNGFSDIESWEFTDLIFWDRCYIVVVACWEEKIPEKW